ncbi:MAG TPA: sporulation protein [Gammaproteobacteria bacterium]|nr:sporulation protein [Gammaproteobacteria bacterium]
MDALLKQRLVGAIVLVALAVIFVPMILEGPNRTLVPEMEALPEPQEPASSAPLEAFPVPGAIPDEPEVSVIQTDTRPVTEPEKPPQAAPAPAPPEPEPRPEPEAVKPAPAPEPPAAAPVAQDKPAKPGPLGSWVVQVGSFSTEKNALSLRDRLRKSGFTTQVEKARVDGKAHYRVRVGPFLEKADAEQNRQQIQERLSIRGRVLSYP